MSFQSQSYEKASSNPMEIQQSKLNSYLKNNQGTVYGKKHNFSSIKNYQEFRNQVPIIEDFSQLDSYISDISKGHTDELTAEKVKFFETTSGTSGMQKFIPYTETLLHEFRNSIAIWMHHQHKEFPNSFSGKAFWSISPPLKNDSGIQSEIPIGMESDLDYFDQESKEYLSQVLVSSNKECNNSEEFYFNLALQLLFEESLSFISIWSPNYLLQLDGFIRNHYDELMDAISANKERAHYLKGKKNTAWKSWFPNLSLISCWHDAQSNIWIDSLKSKMGNIPFQQKGLLSTECVISTPINSLQSAISVTSHFYEFINEKNGEILTLDQMEKDNNYEVIATTGGGLYRYRTHDVITVTDFYNKIPIVKFQGKNNETSDYIGEKINVSTLRPVFAKIKNQFPKIDSLVLMPCKEENSIRYYLLLETKQSNEFGRIQQIIEEHLLLNPYYEQGISTGQLRKIVCKPIESLNSKIMYEMIKQKNIKDGDIKISEILPLNFIDIS